MYELWTALEQAREYKWVELSHPLDNDSPYWSGIPEGSVELSKMVYDWGNPMLDCLIQTFKFPGQFGTHIDFPGHFLKGGLLSEAYGARQLVYPRPGHFGLRGQVRPHPRRGLRGPAHRLGQALAQHGRPVQLRR